MLLKAQERHESRRALLAAGPLALLTHVLMVLLFLGYSQLTASPPRPKKPVNRPVSLRRIDARQWASNRASTQSATAPAERAAPLHPKGQVVDVAQGNEQLAPDAKYLATSNNRVKKETRAKEQTSTWSRATATTQARPEAQPSTRGKPAPQTPPPSGIDLAASVFGRRALPSALLTPQKVSGAENEVQERPAVVGTEGGTQSGPSNEASEGGGAPNDDLENVEAGAGTFLNTREWKYASFFNRVKQAVSARWNPDSRLRAKNRELGASRVTVLRVSLRPDGTVADLFVTQSSGLDELDVEAMNAFTKAQPFANPPPALVQNGFISFGFSFHVTHEGLAVPRPFRFR